MTPTPLSLRLRSETASLHRDAERSGIMYQILRGQVDRGAYTALLRALHAVYSALEARLETTQDVPAYAELFDRRLRRAPALADDLGTLHGSDWTHGISTGDATAQYVDHVSRANAQQLVAHAYVRYLGDLSGGQAVGSVITRALALMGGEGTSFYRFPEITDPVSYRARYRAALDALPLSASEADEVVHEAQTAFALNIKVFEEVSRRTAPSAALPPPLSA